MSSMLSSQGVVIATAMVVSSTALFLAISRQFSGTPNHPPEHALRSCLSSEERKKGKKKKKRVQFAESVKDSKGNGEEYRKERCRRAEKTMARRRDRAETSSRNVDTLCRNEMPANRIALYNGILRDRVHRIQCSY